MLSLNLNPENYVGIVFLAIVICLLLFTVLVIFTIVVGIYTAKKINIVFRILDRRKHKSEFKGQKDRRNIPYSYQEE